MDTIVLSPEMLAGIAGAALSLLFSYIPRFSEWFAAFSPQVKRLWMLGLLALAVGAIAALNCNGIIQTNVTCDQVGFTRLVWMFVTAVMSNQATYTITPETKAVKKAKTSKSKQFRNMMELPY